MAGQNRRQFIKNTLAAAATITIAGTKSTGRVLGANEVIRIGVAGLNGRGSSHVGAYVGMQGVQITYLIDPDTRTYRSRLATINGQNRNQQAPQTIGDVRRALEDRNLDAVSIATPNHWHSLMTVWAAQAGKHVYVEKPMSHNVKEGRIAVATARRHNVIVQHGTQSRSDARFAHAVALVKSGQLGKLLVSRGLCYKRRDNPLGLSRTINPTAVPQELDFNLWTGPAPMRDYHENLVPYRWHWFWDFGNGDIGNQGVHEMDKARWAIAGSTLPRSVVCIGGRFGPQDRAETPNTQIAVFDYGDTKLIFEVRGLATPALRGQSVGNIYHCEEGTIVGNNQFFPRGSTEAQPLPALREPLTARPGGGDHFANFIAAIRSGRRDDLNAEILEGHYSSALCHLANVSYRLGENVPFSQQTRAFGDNRDAADTLERMREHLTAAAPAGNGIPVDGLTYRVGRRLEIDASTETIRGNAEANRMLTRQYRAPFVVPERVG